MAARNRHWTPQVVRERIRTSMLVHRLHNHVIDPQKYPMLKTQVQAAQFLVSRVVGRAENPRQVHVEGQLTLTQLIAEAAGVPLDRAEPVAPTVN